MVTIYITGCACTFNFVSIQVIDILKKMWAMSCSVGDVALILMVLFFKNSSKADSNSLGITLRLVHDDLVNG